VFIVFYLAIENATEISRLGRSTSEVLQLVNKLLEKGIPLSNIMKIIMKGKFLSLKTYLLKRGLLKTNNKFSKTKV
jgi:DNA invertase Pin-like site-specific DNA recombinase